MSPLRSAVAPHLSEELLKVLDTMYPERCPALVQTDREIWCMVGQRSVVNSLRAILKEASENVLQNNIAG